MGTIFVQLTLGLNSFISAQGFSRVSMMTVIIGAAANIVLDPIFIFLLDMGVRGAAVATVVSQALSAVWAFKFLCGDKTTLRLKRENMKIEAHIPVSYTHLAPPKGLCCMIKKERNIII